MNASKSGYLKVVLKVKTRCTKCRTKMVDGATATVYLVANKVKANLCSDKCIKDHSALIAN